MAVSAQEASRNSGLLFSKEGLLIALCVLPTSQQASPYFYTLLPGAGGLQNKKDISAVQVVSSGVS